MKISGSVLFGLSALLLLAACASSAAAVTSPGQSPSHAPAAHIASFDPCKLITAAEATKATGQAMVNIITLGGPSIPGACIYRGGKNSVAFVYAQVYPNAATAAAVTAQQFESALNAEFGSGTTTSQDVSGVGDRAIEITANGNSGSGLALLVYRANVVFVIGIEPTSDSGLVESLARTAVDRLH